MTNVTEKDLNDIDNLNGRAGGSTSVTLNQKGALSQLSNTYKNSIIFNEQFKFLQFFIGLFEYENLPDELPSHFLEQKALTNGKCYIVKLYDKLYAVNGIATKWDMYNQAKEITIIEPFAPKLNGKTLTNFVEYRSNFFGTSLFYLLKPYLEKYQNLYEKLHVIIKQLKVLTLLSSNKLLTKKQKERLKQAYENDDDIPIVLFENKTSGNSLDDMDNQSLGIDTFNTETKTEDYIKLDNYLTQKMREILGIPLSSTNDNRERLLSGELESSNNITNNTLKSMYNVRKWQIEKINKMFNYNIKLKEYIPQEVEENSEDNAGEIEE